MNLETIRSSVRSLHASYGFEQRIRELIELLIKEVQRQQEEIEDLQHEVEALKAPTGA